MAGYSDHGECLRRTVEHSDHHTADCLAIYPHAALPLLAANASAIGRLDDGMMMVTSSDVDQMVRPGVEQPVDAVARRTTADVIYSGWTRHLYVQWRQREFEVGWDEPPNVVGCGRGLKRISGWRLIAE